MARLTTDSITLEIKPLGSVDIKSPPMSGWNYYEISVTIRPRERKEMPLFNTGLIRNPWVLRTEANRISCVFKEALATDKISHFEAFEEDNVEIYVFPGSKIESLGFQTMATGSDDDFLIILWFNENEFSGNGYTLGGPGLIIVIYRPDLETFLGDLTTEEEKALAGEYKLHDGIVNRPE